MSLVTKTNNREFSLATFVSVVEIDKNSHEALASRGKIRSHPGLGGIKKIVMTAEFLTYFVVQHICMFHGLWRHSNGSCNPCT